MGVRFSEGVLPRPTGEDGVGARQEAHRLVRRRHVHAPGGEAHHRLGHHQARHGDGANHLQARQVAFATTHADTMSNTHYEQTGTGTIIEEEEGASFVFICLVKRVKKYDPHGDVRMVDP
jgi:hypothetical protein